MLDPCGVRTDMQLNLIFYVLKSYLKNKKKTSGYYFAIGENSMVWENLRNVNYCYKLLTEL